jgi:squalene synthase HpnC
MTTQTLRHLERFGPERCETLTADQARSWCRRLAQSHYENFSVLSPLVPPGLRDDFAAFYCFCRWADDLGDEMASSARSLELLAWWRRELQQCFAGEPRHPVFVALLPTIERHDLPIEPFDRLIQAFEQDQSVRRYESWEHLIAYCRLSADPVGRVVLMLLDEPRDHERFDRSDSVCTALQLTNHWQDVSRDILARDRVYIPREMIASAGIREFDERLRASAAQGWGVDRAFLAQSRAVIKACVERTWPLFERGESLLDVLQPRHRALIWLFIAGGEHVLRSIELWNYETALHRPRLGRLTKLRLIARTWLMWKLAPRSSST